MCLKGEFMFKSMSLNQKIAFFIFMLAAASVGAYFSYVSTLSEQKAIQKAQWEERTAKLNACYACSPACVPVAPPEEE